MLKLLKFILEPFFKIYDYIYENILIRTEKTKRKVKKKFEVEDSINDIKKERNEKNNWRWASLFSEIDDIINKYGQFSEENFFSNVGKMEKEDAIKIMDNYDEIMKDIKLLFNKAEKSGATSKVTPEEIFPWFNENQKKLDLAMDEFWFYFINIAFTPIIAMIGLLSKKVSILKKKNSKIQEIIEKNNFKFDEDICDKFTAVEYAEIDISSQLAQVKEHIDKVDNTFKETLPKSFLEREKDFIKQLKDGNFTIAKEIRDAYMVESDKTTEIYNSSNHEIADNKKYKKDWDYMTVFDSI